MIGYKSVTVDGESFKNNRSCVWHVIGPTVAIIGLSLSSNAIGDLQSSDVTLLPGTNFAAIGCGLVTLFVTMLCSVYGRKMMRLIPFIIGILAGYAVASVLTLIGDSAGIDALRIIDLSVFRSYMLKDGVTPGTFIRVPDLVFINAADGLNELSGSYLLTVFVAYVPVAFVVFAEHIADHKNLSSVIGRDLLTDPGLPRTLFGDGVGSFVGAFFGGCPNTTYGESVGCVAITKNASVVTIITAATGCILLSFITPFVAFVDSIPKCVMGGVCVALYGFIAVSGLKMLGKVDLDDDRNLFTASVILIAGIGGLSVSFGAVALTETATALILGMIVNLMLSRRSAGSESEDKGEN